MIDWTLVTIIGAILLAIAPIAFDYEDTAVGDICLVMSAILVFSLIV